jgi:Protein required for attachment to host cells
MKHAKIWYVIADGGRARFVERDEGGEFRTVCSFVASELHKRAHDLGLDRPPRTKESASPARHAIEPRRDLHPQKKTSSSSWPISSRKSISAASSMGWCSLRRHAC